MIEDDIKEMRTDIDWIKRKVAELSIYLIPEVKDQAKHLAEAKKLTNKGKPPRKQPRPRSGYMQVRD